MDRTDDEKIGRLVDALQKSQADSWEIYYTASRELSMEVQDGDLSAYQAARSLGAGVRLLTGSRLGSSILTDFTPDGVAQAVAIALQSAQCTDPDPNRSFLLPAERGQAPHPPFDESLAQISSDEKLAAVKQLEAA